MPNSVEAVAREIREILYRELPIDKDGYATLYDIWAKDEHHIQQLRVQTQRLVDALTTFAAQQVQATWEEAAKVACASCRKGIPAELIRPGLSLGHKYIVRGEETIHFCTADAIRRRAQEEK